MVCYCFTHMNQHQAQCHRNVVLKFNLSLDFLLVDIIQSHFVVLFRIQEPNEFLLLKIQMLKKSDKLVHDVSL